MRVPTLQTTRETLHTIQQRQAEQARLQSQVATGLRVRSPGDDPVAAAQAELARSRLARLDQDQRAAQLATGVLSAADGALAHGVSVLQSAREGLIAAGNGAYTADDRAKLALQLRSARAELLSVANTSDGAGGYVFGGQGADAAPFSADGSTYLAAAGSQRIGEEARFATTLDGRAAFLDLPQGNGVFVTASAAGNTGNAWIDTGSVSDAAQLTGHAYEVVLTGAPGALTYEVLDTTAGTVVSSGMPFPAGGTLEVAGQRVTIAGTPSPADRFTLAPSAQQSVFATLDEAIALLEDPAAAGAGYNERLTRVQASLDRGLDGLLLARTRAGEELRLVENASLLGDQKALDNELRLGDLQDADLARVISDLQSGQAGLEAALKSYTAIGRRSLFDLIS